MKELVHVSRDSVWSRFEFRFSFLAQAPRTADVIDLYDVREIIQRLSGNKFDNKTLTKIAEAVSKIDVFQSGNVSLIRCESYWEITDLLQSKTERKKRQAVNIESKVNVVA